MDNQELLKRVEALEEWKRQREQQQITFPLDAESVEVLNKDFVRVVDEYTYFGGVGTTQNQNYVAVQNGNQFQFGGGFIEYTANPGLDTINIINQVSINKFANDQTVILFTSDTTPGGLDGQGLVTYYVVEASTDGFSFKLSDSEGGSAINITSAGVGRQLLQRI
jgi:hypothetical protein